MSVVLRGGGSLGSLDARQVLAESVDRLGHELGASTVAVTFPRVPDWLESTEIHETEADWVVE